MKIKLKDLLVRESKLGYEIVNDRDEWESKVRNKGAVNFKKASRKSDSKYIGTYALNSNKKLVGYWMKDGTIYDFPILVPGYVRLGNTMKKLQIKSPKEIENEMKMLVRESIDIAKKYAKGNEELIASNESYWQWEYDTSINHALLFMKANGDLRLSVSNEHIKSGLGKGEFYKELESENVGSVRKPDIARIKNLVKKHGHDRTRAGGPFKSQWYDVLNSKTDLLTNIIKQYKSTNEGSVAWNKQPSFVDEYSTKSVNRNNLKKFLDYLSGNDINHYFDGSQEILEFDSNELSRKGQELIKKIGLKEL